MPAAARLGLGVLADRNFALYSLGNTISWIGTWAQRIGIGWLSWQLSHSASTVGVVALLQFLPFVVCAPAFGVLLDRTDSKHYAVAVNSVLALLSTLLWLLTALELMSIPLLCVLAVLIGVANSAYQPARLAIINDVAPPTQIAEAIAVNSILFNLTRTIGPAIAGVAIAWFGIAATFAINSISFAAIVGALLIVHIRPSTHLRVSHGFRRDIVAGVRYVLGHAFIRELMLLSLVTSTLARGALELLPAYADGIYHRGSTGLAALTTASGAGAMLGAALLSRSAHPAGIMPLLARSGALSVGVALTLLGTSPSYWTAIVVMIAFGLVVVLCSVGLQTMLQSEIEVAYRGRVLALWGVCNIAGPGVGGAVLGSLAQIAGLRAVSVVSGLLCTACAAMIMRRSGLLTARACRSVPRGPDVP